MLLAQDQLHPEPHQVDESAAHAGEVEELALAVGAVVVVDGHLGDPEPVVLDLLHQLHADHAGRAGEPHLVEHLPPHQAEVAVHVPQAQAEERAHEGVIEPADDDAVQRIGPADLVAVHEVHVRAQRLVQLEQLPGIVLGVAVGVEDQLLGRGGEARAQRAAVTAVGAVVDDLEPGEVGGHLVQERPRVVRAAVVDHDDLVVVRQLARGHVGDEGEARDGARVVVRGKEDGEAGPRWGQRMTVARRSAEGQTFARPE